MGAGIACSADSSREGFFCRSSPSNAQPACGQTCEGSGTHLLREPSIEARACLNLSKRVTLCLSSSSKRRKDAHPAARATAIAPKARAAEVPVWALGARRVSAHLWKCGGWGGRLGGGTVMLPSR